MRATRLIGMLAGALLLMGAGAAVPQEPAAPTLAYERGWHIVRPGDTLIGITRRYLGSSALWMTNWGLNPEVENPDLLFPGQRIRILLQPRPVIPTARVKQMAGSVQNRPAPIPWADARSEDLLLGKDGHRTQRDGSSELEFPDGPSLVLTEDTVIFLRPQGRRLVGVDARSVEILVGQADLDLKPSYRPADDVEILMGEATMLPRAGESGQGEARARRASDGDAQVMVYEGESRLEAAGTTVSLARGTGSFVPPGQPPSDPEPLLPAPPIASPGDGARLAFGNPRFRWQPVEGAVGYTVEVCRDPRCGALVSRVVSVEGGSWQPPASLPVGDLYWRVTAVAPSGLDGYPSRAARFAVTSSGADRQPPSGRLALEGARVLVGERVVADEAVRVLVELEDPEAGVDHWLALVNGEEGPAELLDGPWLAGSYEVAVAAFDGAGNRGETLALSFQVDSEPPEISWSTLEGEERGKTTGRGDPLVRALAREQVRWIEWSVDGDRWLPWFWSLPESLGERARSRLQGFSRRPVVDSDNPQLLLRAPAGSPLAESSLDGLEGGGVVRIRAVDRPAGVRRLELRAVPGRSPERLELSASDLLGHATHLEWKLAR